MAAHRPTVRCIPRPLPRAGEAGDLPRFNTASIGGPEGPTRWLPPDPGHERMT